MRIAVTADPEIPVPPILYGGIERVIDFLVRGLKNNGFEVVLVANEQSKVEVDILRYKETSNPYIRHIHNIATITQLREFKPQIIHSFSRLGYLLPFFRSKTQKLMSYQREPTTSQIQKAMILARRGSLSFTGCSKYIADKISPFAPSYAIYNGIDITKYEARSVPIPDAPLVFLGRIEPIKGPHTAIKVARKAGKELIIAGNIPNEYNLYFEKEIKPHLGVDVRYIGPVNDTEKNILLRDSSALLMPIHWNEPFGIVMAEAMACGTPVIAFNHGAASEVVMDGLSGYMCNTVDEMATKILSTEKLNRKEIRSYCEQRFSNEVIVSNYIALYKKLLDR